MDSQHIEETPANQVDPPDTEPPVSLVLAFATDKHVTFAVDPTLWKDLVPKLEVDENTFRAKPVAEWAPHQKLYQPRTLPLSRVVYVPTKSGSSAKLQVIAIQVFVPNFRPNTDSGNAMKRAVDAYSEFDTEIGRAARAGILNVDNVQGRPTLLNVLSGLLSEDVTTHEQRQQINQLVFAFLQNELSLPKLYSHLAQVTGYSTLRSVVRAISSNGVAPTTEPSTRSLTTPVLHKTEDGRTSLFSAKVSDTKLSATWPAATSSGMSRTGFPVPIYMFKSAEEHTSFFTSNPRTPAYLKDVSATYTSPYWVDIPNSDGLPLRIGHHCLDSSGLWLVLGGLLEESTSALVPANGPVHRKGLNGWKSLCLINQFDFHPESRPLQGPAPPWLFGTSASLTGDLPCQNLTSDAVLVFGGCKEAGDLESLLGETPVAVSDELYVLDLQNSRWSEIPKKAGEPWPPARAFHNAVIVLRELAESQSECEMAGLLIFGGVGVDWSRNKCRQLEDAWLYSLVDGTWTNLSVPEGFGGIGSSCAIAGFNRFVVQGGWKFSANKTSLSSQLNHVTINEVEGGPWQISVSSIELAESENGSGGMNDDSSSVAPDLSRALHTAAVLRLTSNTIKPYDLGTYFQPFENETKNILVLFGGCSSRESISDTLIIFDLHGNDDCIDAARFVRSIAPQLRPFGDAVRLNPLPRSFGTVNFVQCLSPVPSARPKPPVPCLFILGGYPVPSANTLGASPSRVVDPSFQKSWLVSFQSVDPFEVNWFTTSESPNNKKRKSSSSNTTEQESLSILKRRKGLDSREVQRLLVEHLRHNAAWASGLNFSPGIFQCLGAMVSWPFSAIGNLIDNAACLSTRATQISVDFGVAASDGSLFLSISDNGRGMPYTTVNRALKRFGNWDGPLERRDLTRSHPTLQYGMGVKFACSRLGQSCMLISRTRGTIGVALLSQKLHFHTDSQTTSCPICFWRLPSKDMIFPEAEHWQNQQKLQQYSPFDTPAALAEQINTLGPRSGTRFVFFDWKKDFPLSIAIDKIDGTARLSSAPPRKSSETHDNQSSSSEEKISLKDSEDLMSLDSIIPIEEGVPKLALKFSPYSETGKSYLIGDGHPYGDCDDSLFSDVKSYLGEHESGGDSFSPVWSTARDSVDYSLATYLYWSQLFCAAKIWHGGKCLVPPGDMAESDDPFVPCLYRYLKGRLNGMVELDYLFSPSDAQAEGFGLLGFLNPLESLIQGENGNDEELSVYESGIFLYYRERLIKRLFVPFPAPAELLDRFGRAKYPRSHFEGRPMFMFPCTGIIHVPDWLFPTPNREDFVASKSPLFDDFVYQLKRLISSYLTVCLDEKKRTDWVLARGHRALEETDRPLSPLLHMALLKYNAATSASSATS